MITESQLRIDSLSQALRRMADTTTEISTITDGLTRRARHLDSLTSPASETSAMLTQSANNLNSTLSLMKDAREKFDTVQDCEPAIQRLLQGAQEAMAAVEAGRRSGLDADAITLGTAGAGAGNLTEQDVYAAVDSMEIIRDTYAYFLGRTTWRSTPSALGDLERSHQLGVDAMCLLIAHHLNASGAAVKMKRPAAGKKKGGSGEDQQKGEVVPSSKESAAETRLRLSAALQNRDLMKSVGEYEECLPLESRPVRELRAVFECLGGDGAHLGPNPTELALRQRQTTPQASKVVRTEKVGSGGYCNLVNVSDGICNTWLPLGVVCCLCIPSCTILLIPATFFLPSLPSLPDTKYIATPQDWVSPARLVRRGTQDRCSLLHRRLLPPRQGRTEEVGPIPSGLRRWCHRPRREHSRH